MKLQTYPDREMMMIDLANQLAGELNEAVMIGGQASFVVPGGSTPGPIFDTMSAVDIDWSAVTVIPSDERWVPETSEHSNARLIRSRLLTDRAAEATFLPLYAEGDGPEALPGLEAAVAPHLPISVLLLGMGADMHTASLFPGEAALRPEHRHAKFEHLHFVKVPGLEPKVSRMTLTVPALNTAQKKHIVITGAEKRAALEEAQSMSDPFRAPITAVLAGATVHWAE
ncbi:MAG: 6-phosphogluconolactonase [Pseudomonadota bacterium]